MSESINLDPLHKVMNETNSLLSKKEIYGILLSGTPGASSNTLSQSLVSPIHLNPNATHKVYLAYFVGWNTTVNIITGVNDNFTYIVGASGGAAQVRLDHYQFHLELI